MTNLKITITDKFEHMRAISLVEYLSRDNADYKTVYVVTIKPLTEMVRFDPPLEAA